MKYKQLTESQLASSEDAVFNLSHAFGLTESEAVELIHCGISNHYGEFVPPHIWELLDGLRSSFDAY
jgi:hypothetical protein